MRLWPRPRDLVTVHEATSEFEATAVRDALAAAGLPAMVRSRRIPGYGVLAMRGGQAGIWAEVLVRSRDEDQARRVVAEYLASLRPTDDADVADDARAGPRRPPSGDALP